MSAAAIARTEIDGILASGGIIERYPDDEPYPNVLMLGWSEARPIHVVAAHNSTEDEIIIIAVVLARSRAVGPGVPSETEAHIMIRVYCKTGDPTSGSAASNTSTRTPLTVSSR